MPGDAADARLPLAAAGGRPRLVLLGGGHAHVQVLADLAARPWTGWDLHLVSPYRCQIYSGMLPGWVAGHYPIEACAMRLDALADRAGVAFHVTAGWGVDLQHGAVPCADDTRLRFDTLSIDTGPVPALHDLPGCAEHALPLRPIEAFIAAWPALVLRIRGTRSRFHLVILGAGAAGVELAFAILQRAAVEGWTQLTVTVMGSDELPLPGAPAATRHHATRLFAQRGIVWRGGSRATGLVAGQIQVETGPPLPFDACLAATGAAAPDWPAACGLATDARGFIRVSRALQSLSHPNIFAAGDVAAYADTRPKSGVFAVRAGPVLAANLRAFCAGRALQDWQPQAHALYLISTGDRHALATWGRWSWSGRWVWRWKDRIDRQFMQRFGAQAP